MSDVYTDIQIAMLMQQANPNEMFNFFWPYLTLTWQSQRPNYDIFTPRQIYFVPLPYCYTKSDVYLIVFNTAAVGSRILSDFEAPSKQTYHFPQKRLHGGAVAWQREPRGLNPAPRHFGVDCETSFHASKISLQGL